MKNLRLLATCTGASLLTFVSCASTPKFDDNSQISAAERKDAKVSVEPSTAASNLTPYKFADKTGSVEWVSCTPRKVEGQVLTLHRLEAGFNTGSWCRSWSAQVFLKKNLQVLAVNRPSYGRSTGGDDLSGSKSLEAIHAAVLDAKFDNIAGIWAYGTGTIAAAFYAKKFAPQTKWLLLGGGVYDLELTERQTQSTPLKNLIAELKKSEGDQVLESRSIAWDYAGIPKLIGIYHAVDDVVSPLSQANSFTDQLRTSEYKVFRSEVAGSGHDIPWQIHHKVATTLLEQITTAK